MIDNTYIENKLISIKSYYDELTEILNYSDEEIKSDFKLLRATERLVQLIVDEIIDINKHIIKYGRLQVPEDTFSTFLVLGTNNILPPEFAKRLAPVVGLRNRLVHRYEKIDVDLLLKELRRNSSDFEEYLRYIFQYIQDLSKDIHPRR